MYLFESPSFKKSLAGASGQVLMSVPGGSTIYSVDTLIKLSINRPSPTMYYNRHQHKFQI